MRHRLLAGTMAAALLLVGCSGSNDDDLFADSVAAESGDAALSSNAQPSDDPAEGDDQAASGEPAGGSIAPIGVDASEADLTATETAALLDAYEGYLLLADGARIGNDRARADLAGIASPAVLDDIDTWLEENEALADEDLNIVGLRTISDADTITGSAETAIVHDCLEVQLEDEFLNFTRSNFVDQLTVFKLVNGQWVVDAVQVRHDGSVASGPLGCVPRPRKAELEQLLRETMAAMETMWADPSLGADPVKGLMTDALVADAESEMAGMDQEGIYIVAPQNHTIEVTGSDALLGGFVVATCTGYPEGMPARSKDTGEVLEDVPMPTKPGSFIYREWEIRDETVDGGDPQLRVAGMRLQDLDSGCGGE
ncbi:MAG: hypothetical protein WBM50_24340 [Acidimicrobiales bacterium]